MKRLFEKWKIVSFVLAFLLLASAIAVPVIKKNSNAASPDFSYDYNGTAKIITEKALSTLKSAGGILSDQDIGYYRTKTKAESANVDNYLADYSPSWVLGLYKIALPNIGNSVDDKITRLRTQADGNEAVALTGFNSSSYEKQFNDYVADQSIAGSTSYEGLTGVIFSFISNASTNGDFINGTVKDLSAYTISGYSLRDFVWCYLRPDLYTRGSYDDLKKMVSQYSTSLVGTKKPTLSLVNGSVSNVPVAQDGDFDIYGPYSINCSNTRNISSEKVKLTPSNANATIMRKTGSSYEPVSSNSSCELSIVNSSTDTFYVRVPQGTSEAVTLSASVFSYQENLSFRRSGAPDSGYKYCAIPIMVETNTTSELTVGTLGFKAAVKVSVVDDDTTDPVNANFSIYKVVNGEERKVKSITSMTGGSATVDKLSYGTYKIKLTSAASKKYNLSDTNEVERTVVISKADTYLVNFSLRTITANVNFGIYDVTGDKALSSGEITIYKLNADAGTVDPEATYVRLADSNGKLDIELPYGEYKAVQTATPEGYTAPAPEFFSITKQDKVNNASVTHSGYVNQKRYEHVQFYDDLYEATIAVNVVDASGETNDQGINFVPGATVYVIDTTTHKTVIADVHITELGQKLSKLPCGSYAVIMSSAPDYYVLNDYPYEFTITEDSGSETVTIPISKGLAAIQYLAQDSNGASLEGVYIEVDGKRIPTPTDNTGSVYVSGLKAGTKHTVEACAVPSGYVLEDGTVHHVTVKDTSSVSVCSDQFRKAVGKITVKLTDRDNSSKYIEGATFVVEFEDGTLTNYVTDKKGEIEILAPTGKYTIYQKYAPEGYGTTDKSYTFLIGSSGAKKTCSFTNTKVSADVKITAIGKDTTGIVDNVNLEGATFNLYDASTNKIVNGVSKYITDSDGTVTIKGLDIGSYYLVQETSDSNGYYSFNRKDKINFSVKDASTVTIRVTNYIKYGTIYFQYLDEDTGKGVPGATFKLYTKSGKVVSAFVSDKNGQVVFDQVPYGSGYFIKMTKAPEGYELYTGKIGSAFKQNKASALTKAADSILSLGMITAHAANDSTITVDSAQVSINGAKPDGSADNGNKNPGSTADVTYESDANKNPNKDDAKADDSTKDDAKADDSKADSKDDSKDDSKADSKDDSKTDSKDDSKGTGPVVSATKIKGDIAVTVLDSNGSPIAGVTVTAYRDGVASGTATTNSAGVATFTKMVYGKYTLTVTTPGYVGSSASVSVNKSGGTYSATITVNSGKSTQTSKQEGTTKATTVSSDASKDATKSAAATTESAASFNATTSSNAISKKKVNTLNTGRGVDTLNTNKDVDTLDTGKEVKEASNGTNAKSVTVPKTGADDIPVPALVVGVIGIFALGAGIWKKFF